MPNMTWDEFKDFIDFKLEEKHATGAISIRFMDFVGPSFDAEVDIPVVQIDKNGLTVYS